VAFDDIHGAPIRIGTGAAISATATKLGAPIPLALGSTTVRKEIAAIYILDSTAITGDNTNFYTITVMKGTVAAPVVVAYHRFTLGNDLAANVALAMDIDGANAGTATTTLNEGATLTATDTTLTVTSAAAFPATGKFKIKIDDEVMYVTAGGGTTSWTVTRAQNGTRASTHADGATITMVITEEERRLTSGDQLHFIATKAASGSDLSINFAVYIYLAENFLYGAETYPA
jgi:hypothetical protein